MMEAFGATDASSFRKVLEESECDADVLRKTFHPMDVNSSDSSRGGKKNKRRHSQTPRGENDKAADAVDEGLEEMTLEELQRANMQLDAALSNRGNGSSVGSISSSPADELGGCVLTPHAKPGAPTPPKSSKKSSSHQSQEIVVQQPATTETVPGRQAVNIRKGGKGEFLWTCDLCGSENRIADVVHAVRRGGVRDGKLQCAAGDDYSMTCATCKFRPHTI